MKLLKRSLLLSVLIVPGALNAAMLTFNVDASTDFFGTQIGLLEGSHFVVDTSVPNSSSDPSTTQFSNSIVGGTIITSQPGQGEPTTTEITDANSATIEATNDGSNTTWTVNVVNDEGQEAKMTMLFNSTDFFGTLEHDWSSYNDLYDSGTILANGIPMELSLTVEQPPAPIPLPPTVYLMASALGMMLWRSGLSVSQVKQLLSS
jgi:hypothetical protein